MRCRKWHFAAVVAIMAVTAIRKAFERTEARAYQRIVVLYVDLSKINNSIEIMLILELRSTKMRKSDFLWSFHRAFCINKITALVTGVIFREQIEHSDCGRVYPSSNWPGYSGSEQKRLLQLHCRTQISQTIPCISQRISQLWFIDMEGSLLLFFNFCNFSHLRCDARC